jgi:hypothetical protein
MKPSHNIRLNSRSRYEHIRNPSWEKKKRGNCDASIDATNAQMVVFYISNQLGAHRGYRIFSKFGGSDYSECPAWHANRLAKSRKELETWGGIVRV